MSADRVVRYDLLDTIKNATERWTDETDYRTRQISVRVSSSSSRTLLKVDGLTIEFDRRDNRDLTDTLRALRDLDYLIDILDTINEPALKGD